MIQVWLARILLAPISLLYGFGVSIRNNLYRLGLLKAVEFNLPIISVGNLSVGGAGKTPHIEYLIRLLNPYLNVSTLSRGYRRKTKGFLIVQRGMTAEHVGDEPLQFKRKFPEIMVTVSESRTFAIPEIIQKKSDVQVVLLDDAFQHRSIKPGLNILLSEYSHLFTKDFLLPSGRLREWRSAYGRADIIIVSKCPPQVTEEDRQSIIKDIRPLSHQRLFFSYYQYEYPYYIFNPKQRVKLQSDWEVLLICAIARTDYLLEYLNEQVETVRVLEYEDHHYYTNHDIAQLKKIYDNIPSKKKIILTTEKDATRLELHRQFLVEHRMPIFVLPVQVNFHFDESTQFNEIIKSYLLNFKV